MHAIAIGHMALQRRPDSVSAAAELSLTDLFAFYSVRIVVRDTVPAQQPGHPDALATQISNLADLWAYLRPLHAAPSLADIAPLRERARQLAAQLRKPQLEQARALAESE